MSNPETHTGPTLRPSRLTDAMRAVVEFHRSAGFEVGVRPGPPAPDVVRLYRDLILEESDEVAAALEGSDLVEVAHELADLVYVCLGAAVRFGIDLGPIFDEVHRANLAKAGGPRRADGKLLKPPGWLPADVRGVLEAQP